MTLLDSIVAILLALAPGVASPGPSFLLVARSAIRGEHGPALACAAGVSAGALVFAVAGVSGLALMLRRDPALDAVPKLAGAAYLAWLGFEAIRSARVPLAAGPAVWANDGAGIVRSFLRGLLCQLSNPKGIVIYASVFATFLPAAMPPGSIATLLVAVFTLELGWYVGVALALGRGWAREAYLRRKSIVDVGAGLAMLFIAARLLAVTP